MRYVIVVKPQEGSEVAKKGIKKGYFGEFSTKKEAVAHAMKCASQFAWVAVQTQPKVGFVKKEEVIFNGETH